MAVISRYRLLSNLYMVHAAVLHIIWGICLLISEEPTKTTPINQLANFVPSRYQLGILLIVLSVIILIFRWRGWRVRLIIAGLQSVMIILSALGPVLAVWNSHYADLEIRPRLFIFSDQIVMILFAVFYLIATALLGRGEEHSRMLIEQRRTNNG